MLLLSHMLTVDEHNVQCQVGCSGDAGCKKGCAGVSMAAEHRDSHVAQESRGDAYCPDLDELRSVGGHGGLRGLEICRE